MTKIPQFIKFNYDYFVKELSKSKEKNLTEKISLYEKIIESLDANKSSGIELTPEIIEIEINKIIDNNHISINSIKKQVKDLNKKTDKEKIKELKNTAKILDNQNNLLIFVSDREFKKFLIFVLIFIIIFM